jgi:hypothetical protein
MDETERRAEEAERQLMVAVGRCEASRDDWRAGRCRCGEAGGVDRPIVIDEVEDVAAREEGERDDVRSQVSLVCPGSDSYWVSG